MKTKTERILNAAFVASATLILAASWFEYKASEQAQQSSALVAETVIFMESLDGFLNSYLDAETGVRGFLITRDENFLESYIAIDRDVQRKLENIGDVVRNNPNQLKNLRLVEELGKARLNTLAEMIALGRAGKVEEAVAKVKVGRGKRAMDDLRRAIRQMKAEEEQLLLGRESASYSASQWALMSLICGNALALLLMGGGFIVLRRQMRQRLAAEEALRKANTGLEGKIAQRTDQLKRSNEALLLEVAERRETAGKLQDAQDRLAAGLSAAKMGTWIWDVKTNRMFADEFLARMFSVTPEQAAGGPMENFQKAIHPEDLERVKAGFVKSLRAGQVYEDEYRLRQSGGDWLWFNSRGEIERDAAGRAVRMIGGFMDISERKAAEEKVQSLAQFPHENPGIVMRVAKDGPLLFANRASDPLLEFYQAKVGEPIPEMLLRTVQLAHMKGKIVETELVCGPEIWSLTISPVAGRGYVNIFGRNITDRKRAEEALRNSESRFKFLHELGEATRTMTSPDDIMEVATRLLGRHLRVSRCAYADVEADSNQFTIQRDYTDGCASSMGNYLLSQFGLPVAATLREGKTLVIRDVDDQFASETAVDTFNKIGIKAVICCPLVKNDRLEAMMAVHQTTPRSWRKAEIHLVEAVAELCWSTIQRARAEAALRDAQTRLETGMHAGSVGTWVWDIVNNRIYADKFLARAFSVTPEHAAGGPREAYLKAMHPDDLPRNRELTQAALRSSQQYEAEYRLRQSDGTWRWFNSRGQIERDTSGNPTRLVGALIDITERKRTEEALRESEERFRNLGDNIAQLAWMADEKGSVIWYNQRWFDYTGTTLEDMQSRGREKVLHPDHRAAVEQKWKDHLQRGERWEDIFPLLGKDGQYRWFLSRAIPIRDAQGNVLRWFGTNTDITGQRDIENALVQAQKELRDHADELEARVKERTSQLQESLNTMEGYNHSIAHDLRSPLRAMQGFSELVLEEYGPQLDEKGKDYLRRIKGAAVRMDQLVKDLLAYGRLSHVDLPLENLDVELIVRKVMEDVAHEIASRQAQIKVCHPLPVVVAHPVVLNQIFHNLITNAIKFVPKETIPCVTIRAEPKGDWLRLWIEDNGLGIDPAHQKRIFEMFQRLHTQEVYPGTGIGLALVKKGVERLGGKCGVESEVGKGSRFWIELPMG